MQGGFAAVEARRGATVSRIAALQQFGDHDTIPADDRAQPPSPLVEPVLDRHRSRRRTTRRQIDDVRLTNPRLDLRVHDRSTADRRERLR